ncbi:MULTISPECIES: DUF6545 domain-containing protein [Streptomyces violaceusniger group]|uniref:DUF6545 domain-containing protein n=2 Tax=Streptomyces rhizosphaericus TaxID=114699 RepID=A0ABN1SP69_9ACTN
MPSSAVAEAAQIKAALQAREAGDSQRDTADVPHGPAAGDMRVERDGLIRVAKAYQRSNLAEEAAVGPRTVAAGVNEA